MGFGDMGNVEPYMSFVRENSNFSNPGVIIWNVHPKKEGSKAGLKNFDIVLGVNSDPINTTLIIQKLKAMKSVDKVTLNIIRDNSFKNIMLHMP